MKKMIGIFLVLFFLTAGVSPTVAGTVFGNYGDLMLLYAPCPLEDPLGIKAERDARNYEESLLHLGIPQYIAENQIHDEALVRGEFFYHTEICDHSHKYRDEKGMTWRRYRFTDLALQLLSIDQVVEVQSWIVSNQEKYRIPFDETQRLYIRYIQGQVDSAMPVKLMIGTEYGQSLKDYTNFEDFYDTFMNKHHYCITVVFWSIQKSMYDCGDETYRTAVEDALSDPQRVQSFDTLLAGRLVGMLLDFGLIEEYIEEY